MIRDKIVEGTRKAQLAAEEITLFKNSFVIVPYQISGMVDYTNRGFVDKQVNPQDYETFKRIWTGNDSCTLNWKGSITFTKGLEDDTAQINFNLGEVILGYIEGNNSNNQINSDESFSEYKAQQIKNTYTFTIHPRFQLDDYWTLMFYKIPELSGSTLYRIVDLQRQYVGRELQAYIATFESVNQDLANTGRSRLQNIMPNAPGQGYLECIVYKSKEEFISKIGQDKFNSLVENKDYYVLYDRYITADYEKMYQNPVVSVVVKCFGLPILSNVSFIGRPTNIKDSLTKYQAPRLLFPYKFDNDNTPNLFHSQSNINNYYFGEFLPTIQKYKEWKEGIKDVVITGFQKYNFEGFFKFIPTDLEKTNPEVNGGYKYELWGGYDRQQTNSTNEKVPWSFSYNVKQIDTQNILGCDKTYTIGEEKEIHNHMWDNYWVQKNMKSLPLTQTCSVGGGILNDFIGGILNFFGIPLQDIVQSAMLFVFGTFINTAFQNFMNTFRGIIPCEFIKLMKDYLTIDTINKVQGLPFDSLKSSSTSDTPSSMYFNNNTMITSFKAELTDKFVKNGTLYSTLDIGQTPNNSQQVLVNGSERLTSKGNDVDGYIIDVINICAAFDGEYSVEFLDYEDNVIWTSVFQSAGMWSDSLREINTSRNTSVYNRENMYFETPFKYPEEISFKERENLIYDYTLTTDILDSSVNYGDYPYNNKAKGTPLTNRDTSGAGTRYNKINSQQKVVAGCTYRSNAQTYLKVFGLWNKVDNYSTEEFLVFDYSKTAKVNSYQDFKNNYPYIDITIRNTLLFDNLIWGVPYYDLLSNEHYSNLNFTPADLFVNESQKETTHKFTFRLLDNIEEELWLSGTADCPFFLNTVRLKFIERDNKLYAKFTNITTTQQDYRQLQSTGISPINASLSPTGNYFVLNKWTTMEPQLHTDNKHYYSNYQAKRLFLPEGNKLVNKITAQIDFKLKK